METKTLGIAAMVTIDTIAPRPTRQKVALPVRKGALLPFRGLARALKLWWRARSTRVQLSQLTEEQLRDVGLSAEMAAREIRKSRLLLLDRPVQPPM